MSNTWIYKRNKDNFFKESYAINYLAHLTIDNINSMKKGKRLFIVSKKKDIERLELENDIKLISTQKQYKTIKNEIKTGKDIVVMYSVVFNDIIRYSSLIQELVRNKYEIYFLEGKYKTPKWSGSKTTRDLYPTGIRLRELKDEGIYDWLEFDKKNKRVYLKGNNIDTQFNDEYGLLHMLKNNDYLEYEIQYIRKTDKCYKFINEDEFTLGDTYLYYIKAPYNIDTITDILLEYIPVRLEKDYTEWFTIVYTRDESKLKRGSE